MASISMNITFQNHNSNSKNWPTIGVVGAGVCGISTALAISQTFSQCPITIYSEKLTPDTTGDGAAGLWGPFLPYETPAEKFLKWALPTWNLLDTWCKRGDTGVFYVPKTTISKDVLPHPAYKNITYGFKELNQEELKSYGSEYVNGYHYTTIMAEASYFLPRMMAQIKHRGGNIIPRKLSTLNDLSDEVDIIVNCSGLGSYDLVPDTSMYPIRGQLSFVKAPWIKHSVNDASEDSFCYIIPNSDKVILGGTHQEGDWKTTVDEYDKKIIYERNCNIMPGLEKSEFISDWVGLRPARKNGIRIETEQICSKYGKKTEVVHNYGHSGAGVSLMWGCALEACEQVGNVINKQFLPPLSKF